jgi:hypothetical protein
MWIYGPNNSAGLFTFDYDLGHDNGGVYYLNPNSTDTVSTGVDRTPGWHQFIIDSSPGKMIFQVDGKTVYSTTNAVQVTQVSLLMFGPSWRPAWVSYFDDFSAVFSVPPTVTAPAGQAADEGESRAFDLGSFADPGPEGPWAVDVDWGDGTPHTIFHVTSPGSLGSQGHT